MQGLIVHLGAGRCSEAHGERLRAYLKEVLHRNKLDLPAVLQEIELSGRCNAGTGSHQTSSGRIENEACVMQSNGSFAGVCMVPPELPASQVALDCLEQQQLVPLGYIKPLAVVYQGKPGPSTGSRSSDHAPPATPATDTHAFGDTIGGIEFSAAASRCISSSGGTKNKVPGRIGPCSVYGANTFANGSVSICISGTGESLIRGLICRRLARRIEQEEFEEIQADLEEYAQQEAEFPYLGGIAVLRKPASTLLVHFQTAPCFVFGYKTADQLAAVFHHQPDGQITVHVSHLLANS